MKTALIFGLFATLSMIMVSALGASWMDDWAKMEPIKPRGYVCYQATGSIRVDGNRSL